jgi:hypothetical protein
MISTGRSKIVFGDFLEIWLFEDSSGELKMLEASIMTRFDDEIARVRVKMWSLADWTGLLPN